MLATLRGSTEREVPQLLSEYKGIRLVEPEEFPDTTLPKAKRAELKSYVNAVKSGLNHHELMYLSCAFEDAARETKGARVEN